MPRRPVDADPVRVTAADLAAELARLCPANRVDLVGAVSLPAVLHHEDRWWDFLAEGRHGDLEYLARDPGRRVDPTVENPWARSLLVFELVVASHVHALGEVTALVVTGRGRIAALFDACRSRLAS